MSSDSEDEAMEIVYISSNDEDEPPADVVDELVLTENDIDNANGHDDTASEENLVMHMNDENCSNEEDKPEASHVNAASNDTNIVVIYDTSSESHYPCSSHSSNSLSQASG